MNLVHKSRKDCYIWKMKVKTGDKVMFSCLACADAYLTPHIKRYVQGFSRGFQKQLEVSNLENIPMVEVNNGNTRRKCGICSELTIKTPERRRSGVFIINFERISHLFLLFLLLALNFVAPATKFNFSKEKYLWNAFDDIRIYLVLTLTWNGWKEALLIVFPYRKFHKIAYKPVSY